MSGNLLTFGRPDVLQTEYGSLIYGAETPYRVGEASGKCFVVSGVASKGNQWLVYGMSRSETRQPQVWSAQTRDGLQFEKASLLFEVPVFESPVHWAAGDVALGGNGELMLLQCHLGNPPIKGHPFHAWSGGLDGTQWRALKPDGYVYRGQDALSVVWNDSLGLFVNYQTSYQPFPKRYPDNMPKVRRVLHIRTSPDGLHWTPGESFGADGPYLADEHFITPDEIDSPDTEFYHFSAVDLGEFWAGTMVKYVSQPKNLPHGEGMPHGPYLDYEWWISSDGLTWTRPFRERSGLGGMPRELVYRLAQPIVAGDELRWVPGKDVYGIDRRRFFYAYGRANTEVVTPELRLSGTELMVDVSFEAVRRNEPGPLRQGYLMAELLDENGAVLPGFEREKCVFNADDRTRLPLRWSERSLPESAPGRRVRLRFCFRDVRLYSMSY